MPKKNGTKTFVHYLSAAEAIVVKSGNNALEYYFPYTDHLGSIVAVTVVTGQVLAEQNFDAWGRKRNPANWTYDNIPAPTTVQTWLYRGYTGHEHLDAFGLINMNARLYDPILGRMLSPDNFVGDAGSQGFNRYSYANNNPLTYTDPSGNEPITLTALLVTALVQGTVSVAFNGIINVASGKNFFQGGLTAFASGAIGGAAGKVLGLIPGLPTAANNVISSVVGYAGGTWATGGEVSLTGLLVSGASAYATPYVMKGLGKAGKYLWGKIPKSVQEPLADIAGALERGAKKFRGWLSPSRSATNIEPTASSKKGHVEFDGLSQGHWDDFVDGKGNLIKGYETPGSEYHSRTPTFYGEDGFNVALGVKEHLFGFTKAINGVNWETWGAKDFQSQFLHVVSNPSNNIHFNLDGIPNVMQAVSQGSRGFNQSRFVTSWELFTIYSNPNILNRTTFYRGGVKIKNPF